MMDGKRGTKEYVLIYTELIKAARYRGTVTYQELADLIGLPLQGNYVSGALGEHLGAISADEVKQNRPMLSAIAINVKGTSSPGFFGLARELGRLKSDDPAEQQAFWQAEKKAVYATWQRSFHEPK